LNGKINITRKLNAKSLLLKRIEFHKIKNEPLLNFYGPMGLQNVVKRICTILGAISTGLLRFVAAKSKSDILPP